MPFDNEMAVPARAGQKRQKVVGPGPSSATLTEAHNLADANRFVVLKGKV